MLKFLVPCCLIYALIIVLLTPNSIRALEITPFRTANRNPLLQMHGIPAVTSSDLQPAGHLELSLSQDVASNYSVSSKNGESILLDGELYRWGLNVNYGITDHLELGIEVPFELQTGGILDHFIMGWHNFFGLPQGGRDSAPNNRLRYRYYKDGVNRLDVSRESGGIGDMSLLAGYQLYSCRIERDHDTLALRTQLTVPTGNSRELLGSGSTDLALFVTGAMNRQSAWGTTGVFASAGGMYSSEGDILKDQRRNLAGFGTVGIGAAPAEWIAFKVQGNFNTPLYKGSSLRELGKNALLLTFGGTLKLPDNYLLDIGVGEDVFVSTAPDVTFNLALSRRF